MTVHGSRKLFGGNGGLKEKFRQHPTFSPSVLIILKYSCIRLLLERLSYSHDVKHCRESHGIPGKR